MTTVTELPADKFDTTTVFVRPDPLPTRAPLDKLAVLPGFNTRVKDEDYSERVATVAESIASHGFFDDKPFAVVMLPNDDTIYIFDGEHRFDAAKQALLDGATFPDGLPIAWAKDGATVKDLTIHLAHGNNGERLNMVELAAVVRRMQGLDMSKDEIAAALGRTTRHVDNLFVLAAANNAVKKAVASGQIAGAEAVKMLRKDPKTAGAKIAEAVKAAADRGKAKATPKTMAAKPTGPKMKTMQMNINAPQGETMGAVLKAMAGMIREQFLINSDDTLGETGMIRFSVQTIDREAEAAAKAAAEAKALKEQEKAAAAEQKIADKKAADEKKATEKKALAAAAAVAAKAAAKVAAKPKSDAKAAAKVKAPAKAKTTAAPKKAPQKAKTPPAAATPAPKAESAPEQASALPPESMGGL